MMKFIAAICSLMFLINCSKSELSGLPVPVNYYININYDTANIFSYEGYAMDSSSLIQKFDKENTFEIGKADISYYFLDSLFYLEQVYRSNFEVYLNYRNGDIDTIKSYWSDDNVKFYFNNELIFSADNHEEEIAFIGMNSTDREYFSYDNPPVIFQCEKKTIIVSPE